MLIMNQAKTALLNVDGIGRIFCAGSELLTEDRNGDMNSIGRYDTNARAAEILAEIAQEYGRFIRCDGGPLLTQEGYVQPFAFEPPKVYFMPEN